MSYEYKSGFTNHLKKQLRMKRTQETEVHQIPDTENGEPAERQFEHDKAKDEERKAERERDGSSKAGIKPLNISKSKQKEKDLIKNTRP